MIIMIITMIIFPFRVASPTAVLFWGLIFLHDSSQFFLWFGITTSNIKSLQRNKSQIKKYVFLSWLWLLFKDVSKDVFLCISSSLHLNRQPELNFSFLLPLCRRNSTSAWLHLTSTSGRSSLAKHGGAYFSPFYGFMKDPIAAPGPYENQEC